MIKVCYIISSLAGEGPTNVLYNIVQYLDFTKYEVSIVTMVKEKTNSKLKEFKTFPIRIIQVSKDKDYSKLSLLWQTRKVVFSLNPDIVHVHCPRSRLLMLLLPSRFVKIETIHNYPDLPLVLYGRAKGTLVKIMSLFVERRLSKCVACSDSIAKEFNNYGIDATSIPNGCSLPIWQGTEELKFSTRKKLGLKNDIKYFIFIGRFSEEKRPELVIKAFEELKELPIGVIMLGDGRLYANLRLHETDRIIMPGFKTNVYEYMTACDYYLSTSDTEGMPNALLESMTVGLPEVLSNIPAHREVLGKSSSPMGIIYDNRNIQELEKAIKQVLEFDTLTVSNEIKATFEREYTAAQMSERYQKLYDSFKG